MNEIFHAQWIKAKKNGKMNAVSFIKTFPVCGAVRRATLSLTAHGVFQAKVGGKPVSDEVLAPGWTVYDKDHNKSHVEPGETIILEKGTIIVVMYRKLQLAVSEVITGGIV